MNDKEKRKLEEKLDAREAEVKRELKDEMRDVREQTPGNVLGGAGDPGDDSLIRDQPNLDQNLARRHANELAGIDSACERMKDESYGVCEN